MNISGARKEMFPEDRIIPSRNRGYPQNEPFLGNKKDFTEKWTFSWEVEGFLRMNIPWPGKRFPDIAQSPSRNKGFPQSEHFGAREEGFPWEWTFPCRSEGLLRMNISRPRKRHFLRMQGFPEEWMIYSGIKVSMCTKHFSKLHWPSKVSKNNGFPVKPNAVSNFFKSSETFTDTTLWSMQKTCW